MISHPRPTGRRALRAAPAVLAVLLVLAAVAPARARTYEFINIADNRSGFGAIGFGYPTINNAGTVAFRAARANGPTGIFTGNGGPVSKVADTSGIYRSIQYEPPAINDAGAVTFLSSVDDGTAGIFTVDATGGTRTIAAGYLPFVYLPERPVRQLYPVLSGFDMDAAGNVAFKWETQPSFVEIRIGNGDSSAVVTAAGPGGAWLLGQPAISPSGSIAFTARSDQHNPFDLYVAAPGAPPRRLALGGFSPIDNRLVINDDDVIAMGNGQVIRVRNELVETVIDGYGDVYGANTPSINRHGDLAFEAVARGTGVGIFTGPDPIADKVIVHGDPLFGSTLMGPDMLWGALNDHGDIAFRYRLTDGRTGIALARLVPEPTGLAALLAAAAPTLLRRRRPPARRYAPERLERRTLLAAGALDTTFDGDGILLTPFHSRVNLHSGAGHVTTMRDGRIVAAGASAYEEPPFAQLARYLPDGRLDPSFGTGGTVTTGGFQAVSELLVASDGAVFVLGTGTDYRPLIARYTSTGVLDPAFHGDGLLPLAIPSRAGSADGSLQSDGRLVVAGVLNDGDTTDVYVTRLNADGSVDTAFGDPADALMGMTVLDLGRFDLLTDMAVTADDRIVLLNNLAGAGAFCTRLTAEGRLDANFGGGDGVVTTTVFRPQDVFSAVTTHAGKVVMAGYLYDTSSQQAYNALARYLEDGSPDPSFGDLGNVLVPYNRQVGDLGIADNIGLNDRARFVSCIVGGSGGLRRTL